MLVRQSLVLEPGSSIDQQLCRFMLCNHGCDLGLNHLVRTDLFTKLSALIGVFNCGFDGTSTDANRASGAANSGIVELEHANLETSVDFTEYAILRDHGALKCDFPGG